MTSPQDELTAGTKAENICTCICILVKCVDAFQLRLITLAKLRNIRKIISTACGAVMASGGARVMSLVIPCSRLTKMPFQVRT